MTDREAFTDIRSLLGALARAMNLVNPEVEHHHEQTAYLAYAMCTACPGFGREQAMTGLYAALLHDVGAAMIEQPATVEEVEHDALNISRVGAEMLCDLPGFETIAKVIGLCQCGYSSALQMPGVADLDDEVLQIASIIHLADVATIMLDTSKPVLSQAAEIREAISTHRGTEFCPEAVDAFLKVTEPEFVWLDVAFNPSFVMLFTGEIGTISLEETVTLTQLISRIIDYRSPFTAMHSAGVAASAKKLAELAGMTPDECLMMEIAGNLHDVGKLRVPRAILEKPGKLTDEEFNIIKEHAYYTRLTLMDIPNFDLIANWAGFHHEKLNGRGYPFHMSADRLDLGSRIMAVADIFSAVAEDRPYRAPMDREQTLAVLQQNVEAGGIDADVVQLLVDHYDEVNAARDARSHAAGKRYYDSIALREGA